MSHFVIRRHLNDSFWMGVEGPNGERDVKITIIELTPNVVRLGIEAPREVDILLNQTATRRSAHYVVYEQHPNPPVSQ